MKDYGPSPGFGQITHWLNSEPLSLDQLRGKVVLIDFWTYSCINCIRTLPYVTNWYDTYKDQGLVVVGVHTPEFAFEKNITNVQKAIAQFNIHYPVAQDNDYGTWKNYQNHYWPAEYLIDKNGNIVYTHFGEGNYDVTENTIRQLLGLETAKIDESEMPFDEIQSPEMYFGTSRLKNLTGSQTPSNKPADYSISSDMKLNEFALEGQWQFFPENTVLVSGPGKIRLKFHAGKIHLVAASPRETALQIIVDGKKQSNVLVKNAQLYTLFDSPDYTDHVIEIIINEEGFEAFTFTFG